MLDDVSFNTIIAQLALMDSDQRKRISVACSILGQGTKDPIGLDPPEELLWRSYQYAAPELELPAVGYARKNGKGWSQFKASAEAIESWIHDQFNPRDEAERHSVYRLIARCILIMVTKRDLPKNRPTLLSQAAYAKEAVEDQYPGYIESGFLRIVLDQKRRS
jgi:hypothetical protein